MGNSFIPRKETLFLRNETLNMNQNETLIHYFYGLKRCFGNKMVILQQLLIESNNMNIIALSTTGKYHFNQYIREEI